MKFLVLLFLPLFLHATTLQTLIEHAKNSHLSLEAIEHKLSSMDEKYALSRNFTNPELSLSISDIQTQDITNRSLEPMQYTALNFKQKIPYFGKRDALSNKINAQKEQISMNLESAKVKLIERIKMSAYDIYNKEQMLQILKRYITLTKTSIDLFSSYNLTDASSHMSLMNSELTLSQLKIKKSRLLSLLRGDYEMISYLSDMNVTHLELTLHVTEPLSLAHYQAQTLQNSEYKEKEAALHVADADVKVQELSKYVDPTLSIGYFFRQKYKDYFSVGVGFSLPIYGSEALQTEVSRKDVLQRSSEVSDMKNRIDSEMAALYEKLQSNYEIYTILQNESLPQLEHMQSLSASAITSGSNLFVYIQMLEKKLSLDEQNIDAISNYYKTKAAIEALIGETR